MSPKHVMILDDRQWPSTGFTFALPIQPESTVLGVIDVQGYFMDADHHTGHTTQKHHSELNEALLQRVNKMIGNIRRLPTVFRDSNRRVFFTRHGIQTNDGGDLIERRRSREDSALALTDGEAGHMAKKGDVAHKIGSRVEPK